MKKSLYDQLMSDCRLIEGLKACINCGTCTAICPAAEFYKYNPKNIVNALQSRDEEVIEELLKGEEIWYCGECMSCVTRCPRKNAPGLIIMALRGLSMELGYFVESEKGRQQYVLHKSMHNNILNYGYCVHPFTFTYEDHPEFGTVGKWFLDNLHDVHDRLHSNLYKEGSGVLRKIPQDSLDELKSIFDITGATRRMEIIEEASLKKAKEMGLGKEEYLEITFSQTGSDHLNR